MKGQGGWLLPAVRIREEGGGRIVERTLRIIRIVVVVLNVMVAVASFRRGDTLAMVIAIAVAVLFLYQLIRPFVGDKDVDCDDRTPPSS